MLLMSRIASYYLETGEGRVPVKEFITSLEPVTRRKFFAARVLLEEFGYALREPHVKYLGHKIFELRLMGREGAIRVLYFFAEGNKVIFTNGFLKKTGRIPEKEFLFAVRKRTDYLRGQAGGLM
jgi:phage-related protein